jgi:Kef-type K+ transport system membrane component KefB/predicted transcriptional regulator
MDATTTGILTILGIGVFGGILGATLFQKLHIPQVVGYIAMGLLIGQVGLGIVTQQVIQDLEMLNLFALGIIGFLVGGELHADIFRKQGKQLFAILFMEGLGAFFVVGVPITLIMQNMMHDWPVALATGIVFGAIASATDPASTLNVLWEYRSRGIVTTTLIAIVALDDALAMTLYGLGTTVAQILTGSSASISEELMHTGMELGGAIALGLFSGLLLKYLAGWFDNSEKLFSGAVGVILLVIGIAATMKMDVILAAMTLGVTLINFGSTRTREIFKSVRSFAEPIYVIFFVLVGARLNLGAMPSWLWGIVALYVVGRSAGKVVGAYLGGTATGAEPTVRKYTGLGLFAQGGIAVGLSIMAAHQLEGIMVNDTLSLADMIIFGITASTLVLQVTGPPLIKLASKLANEIGRDVTEEDVIESWTVAQVMNADVPPITQGTPLSHVFQIFSVNDYMMYPVVDGDNRLKGVLTLDGLKAILLDPETWDWVLAADVMGEAKYHVDKEMSLKKAVDYLRDSGKEEVPVTDESGVVLGVMDQRLIRIRVKEEAIRRRQTTQAVQPATA